MTHFTESCRCPHCGGNIKANCARERIMYWCDRCGANDDTSPPFVEIKFSDGTAAQERPGKERK